MKLSFIKYQQQAEDILLKTYGIKTTLEMRNYIAFCYNYTIIKPDQLVIEILISFKS